MIISVNGVPKIELPEGQIFHRVQRIERLKNSVVINGMILPPGGLRVGRFCLKEGVTAYLADTAETALYEAVFRRELKMHVPLNDLKSRALACFVSKKPLRLVDLRGSEVEYPFLQSLRIGLTQAFADCCFDAGYDGIIYGSAQHPRHSCLCIFEKGLKKFEFLNAYPLVKKGDILHFAVMRAAERSGLEVS